jgi:hypothetical protein
MTPVSRSSPASHHPWTIEWDVLVLGEGEAGELSTIEPVEPRTLGPQASAVPLLKVRRRAHITAGTEQEQSHHSVATANSSK